MIERWKRLPFPFSERRKPFSKKRKCDCWRAFYDMRHGFFECWTAFYDTSQAFCDSRWALFEKMRQFEVVQPAIYIGCINPEKLGGLFIVASSPCKGFLDQFAFGCIQNLFRRATGRSRFRFRRS